MKTLPEVLTLDRPMLGFDLETTGTNPQIDRIVEIGLEIMKPGLPTKEYRTLINPGMRIPPGATKVHGITDEMVKDAPRFEQLAANLLKGFAGADFSGYNVRFDLKTIQAEFKRAGHEWEYDDARIIDGFRLWQILQARSLSDAIAYWLDPKVEEMVKDATADFPRETKAHSALWDVKMATRVIAAQIASSDKLPRDVQKLHDLCSPGWFDAEGKLQWKNGKLRFSFGQHRDKAVQDVPRSYLSWVTTKDFSEKVKRVCRDALNDIYPAPPVEDNDEDSD